MYGDVIYLVKNYKKALTQKLNIKKIKILMETDNWILEKKNVVTFSLAKSNFHEPVATQAVKYGILIDYCE